MNRYELFADLKWHFKELLMIFHISYLRCNFSRFLINYLRLFAKTFDATTFSI